MLTITGGQRPYGAFPSLFRDSSDHHLQEADMLPPINRIRFHPSLGIPLIIT